MAASKNGMRIVNLGRSGNGKSSLGNSLLHSRSAFHATQSSESITRDCKVDQYQNLTVVDTPGFFDTDTTITNEIVKRKIASQIFEMTAPGVHAFLIVIRIGRFTPEEKNTVDFIRQIFGPDAVKYCIVVFTCEDQLEEGQTLNEFINTSTALRELVQACGHRTFAFNNKLNGQLLEKKTNDLIKMIDNMIRDNNGSYYTNAEYQRIERKRQEEKQRKEEEERRQKKAEEDAIIERTQKEERKKHEEEIRKVREEKKAEQREKELRSESNSARRTDDTIGFLSSVGQVMKHLIVGGEGGGGGMSPMNYCTDMTFSPMSSEMEMPYERTRSAGSGVRGAHSGRFTDEHMPTRGAVHGPPIYQGPRRGMTLGGHQTMFSGSRRGH